MEFIWDAKYNFILLHFVNLHQQQSSTSDINWSSIANDVHLEISSTPILLKNQFEDLLEIFYPKKDSKSLYSTLKHIYLHSLCQKIEDDSKLTLETVYELIRHARAKRINTDDIEQLIKEWNFNYSSDQQKENKKRLFNILNRLRDYTRTSSSNSYQSIYYHLPECLNTNVSLTIQKERNNEELESMSVCDEKIPTRNKLINIDNHQLNSNINESEKSSFIRRRTRSLTIFTENQDNKVNIGVEWFVPKLKRQQRSSSLHARSQSPSLIDSSSSQNQNCVSNGILITTIDNDESSDSTKNLNVRQTQAQPVISWLPLTNQQIVEKERRQIESKLIDDLQLEAVSSSDSDSIEIQWSTSSNKKASASSSSHQHEHGSCKRQRLS